ncbi:MAG: diguanylate cyclase [Deltaproteobacteria bacterium]|nr:diguanylate cyclase [Deltaproteobacteria bacterium]
MSPSSLPVNQTCDDLAFTRDTLDLSLPPAVAPRDRATLVVIAGPEAGKVHRIEGDVLIGRGLQCEIQIDDAGVSRVHARIVSQGGFYVLHDMAARNGVFLNGERVRSQILRHGDRMQLGPGVSLRFAMADELEETLMRTLYRSSVRDPLTGVFNRGHFEERLAAEVAYAVRHHSELALAMLDIDHFKRVNDSYGHPAGDKVLQDVGSLLARVVRAEDVACRFGGEEFAVIARGIDLQGACAMAERIRLGVAAARIPWEQQDISITLSAGVASLSDCGDQRTGARLVEVADRRLYAAKEAGRNRVVGP